MSTPASRAMDVAVSNGFVYGHSPAIQSVNLMVVEIARTDIPVLLMGDSGTGKEEYGRLIHRLSGHCQTPLRKLSCRALEPRELLTQWKSYLRGNAECAESDLGTLLLDGVDDLDLACQKVLLSLLPDGDAGESGSNRMRLIACASRNLDEEIESGRFRRELYFRISGVCLRLPLLRERKEDIPVLMEHFLAKHAAEVGREVPVLSVDEMEILETYDWPGNIRELKNLARKIAVLGDTGKALGELRVTRRTEAPRHEEEQSLSLKVAARMASRQAERELILKALERTHWNRKRAAQELQISYKSLLYKIKETGLEGKKAERG